MFIYDPTFATYRAVSASSATDPTPTPDANVTSRTPTWLCAGQGL